MTYLYTSLILVFTCTVQIGYPHHLQVHYVRVMIESNISPAGAFFFNFYFFAGFGGA